jgi:2-methylisocitrate lyase-like PEP mutase family enzyme
VPRCFYAPGVPDVQALRTICGSLNSPVNHVVGQGVFGLSLDEIASAGVRRISVGGSLARAVGAALLAMSREIAAGNFSSRETGVSWNELRSPKPVT